MSIITSIKYNGSKIGTTEGDSVSVTYDGSTIVTITSEGTKTLKCSGKVMKTNLVIGNKTLKCAGKLMSGNIVLETIIATYSITPTLQHCTADAHNPTEVEAGSSASLSFYAEDGYTFDDDIEEAITNASGFSLSNATWTVVEQFPITVTTTHCTSVWTNPTVIDAGGTAQLKFNFNGTEYVCPDTAPTVTGATVDSWVKVDDKHGTLNISDPTGAVSVTVEGEAVPSAGETWVINETPDVGFRTYIAETINFISNNVQFKELTIEGFQAMPDYNIRYYTDNWNYTGVYDMESWTDQAYRTVTFETAPTGVLLTWLQANAVKQ